MPIRRIALIAGALLCSCGFLIGVMLWPKLPEPEARPSQEDAPAVAASIRLAITIDDFPWTGRLPKGDESAAAAIDFAREAL